MEYLTYEDIDKAKENGVSYNTLYQRFYLRGWAKERAISEMPKGNVIKLTSIEIESIKEIGVTTLLFRRRVKRGWSREKASATPIREYGGTKRRIDNDKRVYNNQDS